jgi:integrase
MPKKSNRRDLLMRTNRPSSYLEGHIFPTETESETIFSILSPTGSSQTVSMEPKSAYPYKLAKLNDANGDLSKRWCVSFYVWDATKHQLTRKQKWIPAAFVTKAERIKEAKRLIRQINELLVKGYHLAGKSNPPTAKPKVWSWIQAFDWVYEHRKPSLRKRSIQSLELIRTELRTFCTARGLLNLPLSFVQPQHCDDFMQHLRITRKISNLTYNNYLTFLKLNFNYLVKRDKLKHSPASNLPRLRVEDSEQVSFPPDVRQQLLEAYTAQYPELLTLVKYIFYSFIRPGELRKLQVKHLGPTTISVPGRIAKNKKTEHVLITPGLEKLLNELCVRSYPPDYYLISHTGKPGPKPTSPNFYTGRHLKIRIQLSLPETYTLYCWKHTGVTETYLATRDMDFVSRQCRHSSLDMTKRYLRGLGLLLEYPHRDQLPELSL